MFTAMFSTLFSALFSTLFSKPLAMGLDSVGDRNPQLMREWQGRLRLRNVILAIVPTLLIQVLIVLQRLTELPINGAATNRYCMGARADDYYFSRACEGMMPNAAGWPTMDWASLNWPLFWSDIFRDLSVTLPWVVIIGGVFLLIADFSKESRRGTLNFLRMSPESSRNILLGKLLGVPVLLYLAVVTTLPLHVWSGLSAGHSLGAIAQFDLLLLVTTVFFYTLALWFASLTPKLQGAGSWVGAIAVTLLLILGINAGTNDVLQWSALLNPINILSYFDSPILSDVHRYWPFANNNWGALQWMGLELNGGFHLVLSIGNALMLGLWLWALLERRFQAPGLTAIGKNQSYGVTACLSVIGLGFAFGGHRTANFGGLVPVMVVWAIALMFLLLPSQQMLLDWTRYRRQYRRQSQSSRSQADTPGLVVSQTVSKDLGRDLLHNDASPAVVALAINLAIVLALMAIALVFVAAYKNADAIAILLGWGLSSMFLVNCMLLVQWLSLSTMMHRAWISVGSLLGVILGLPAVLVMLGLEPSSGTEIFWLLTLMPQTVVEGASGLSLLFAFAVQGAIATMLAWVLTKRIRLLGQSEWKALMADRPAQRQLPQASS